MKRRTLRRPARISGVSLRSFGPVSVDLEPTRAGDGIVFNGRWRATPDNAGVSNHMTRVGKGRGTVYMVEHLLATCAGFGVTDLDVRVEGDALPFGDGSCAQFSRAMLGAGTTVLRGAVKPLVLSRPVMVERGGGFIAAVPAKRFQVNCLVRFPGSAARLFVTSATRAGFETELARARTFGTIPRGVSAGSLRRKLGLEFGLKQESGWIRPARLRYPDELCRHKAVDLLGDLMLLGRPLQAEVFAFQPGHRLSHQFVKRVIRETEAG